MTLCIFATAPAINAADAKSSIFCREIGDIKFKWYISYKPFCKSCPILVIFSSVGAQK